MSGRVTFVAATRGDLWTCLRNLEVFRNCFKD
jgi:hypothetical protein